MGIVRFALKFPYTFYVLAMFIVFLGVSATVMPEMERQALPTVRLLDQYQRDRHQRPRPRHQRHGYTGDNRDCCSRFSQ